MKKVVLLMLMVICCGLLAGCGEEADKSAGESGNFYAEFMATDAPADGWYQITAEAHVEDALPLVYLQAAEETTLGLELTFNTAKGDIRLDYINPEGEELPLCGNAVSDITKPVSMTVPLTVAAGESRLQWTATADAAAEADFELTISNTDGVDISLPGVFDEDLAELPPVAEMSRRPGSVTFSGAPNSDSVGMQNFHKALQAGEANLFLSADLAQECVMPLMAALWDFSGDVQLVYVQPDGVEQTLWDSREQDGAEPPQPWQTPWDYVLPLDVAAEDLLTLDLTVNWLPGSGRLEWRTQEGAEFHINILLENYSGLRDNDLSM